MALMKDSQSVIVTGSITHSIPLRLFKFFIPDSHDFLAFPPDSIKPSHPTLPTFHSHTHNTCPNHLRVVHFTLSVSSFVFLAVSIYFLAHLPKFTYVATGAPRSRVLKCYSLSILQGSVPGKLD